MSSRALSSRALALQRTTNAAAFVLAITGCGPDALTPTRVDELPDGDVILQVDTCADATVRVVETATEVRIDRIEGRKLSGDCQGAPSLGLDEPIGGRLVFVNGEEWFNRDPTCELATYVPREVAENWQAQAGSKCPGDQQ